MKNRKKHNKRSIKSSVDKRYDRALLLIQNQVQLFWLVFGAFLLSETVLLGGVATIADKDNKSWTWACSILGLIICLPWWTSFRYNHAIYRLRMKQAKKLEPKVGLFLTEGHDLIKGEKVSGVKITDYARFLGPERSIKILISLFAASFTIISILYNPWYPLIKQ